MIYELDPTEKDKTDLVVIDHNDTTINYIFDKDEMGDYLHKLLTSERSDTLIIEHDYDIGALKMYELDFDTLDKINKSVGKIIINDVIKTVTTKPINYL